MLPQRGDSSGGAVQTTEQVDPEQIVRKEKELQNALVMAEDVAGMLDIDEAMRRMTLTKRMNCLKWPGF